MIVQSHAIINLYLSYDSYRALKQDLSNLELVVRLITWLVGTVYLNVCHIVLDPLFSTWLPMYHFAKVAVALWLIHPSTLGAYLIFVTRLNPWISQIIHELSDMALLSSTPPQTPPSDTRNMSRRR